VRLTLGLGAGENLNKHISWRIVPAAAMRYESLRRRWRSPGDLGRRDGDVSGQACGLHRWATWEAVGLAMLHDRQPALNHHVLGPAPKPSTAPSLLKPFLCCAR